MNGQGGFSAQLVQKAKTKVDEPACSWPVPLSSPADMAQLGCGFYNWPADDTPGVDVLRKDSFRSFISPVNRFADLFVQYRRVVAALTVLLTILAAIGNARVTFDDQPRGIHSVDDENYAFLQEVLADFGSDDNDVILVVEAEDLFAPNAFRAIGRLVDWFAPIVAGR